MDGDTTRIVEGVGEANIGRGVDEQLFARRGESLSAELRPPSTPFS